MIYFTADTHFAHDWMRSLRGFPTVEIHDDVILEGINETVGANDTLYHLGDFAWTQEESFFKRIKCKNIHLIQGNHDRAKVGKLFKTVCDTAEIKINGDKVFLSHYPHAYWPASHYGSYHLYGHVHGQRESTLNLVFPGRRSIDVGLDNAYRLIGLYRPFSWAEIKEILKTEVGHDPVEYYRSAAADGR